MLYKLLGILCSHSLGVGNRLSKSDRPFGGKKEEEGSLLKMLAVANRCSNPSALSHFPTSGFFTKNSVCSKISWCEDVRYICIEKEFKKKKKKKKESFVVVKTADRNAFLDVFGPNSSEWHLKQSKTI